jgi:hypothetical protein
MAFTHNVRYIYGTNAGVIVDISESVVGAQQGVDIDTQILPEVQVEFDVSIVTSNVQSMLIFSDQPVQLITNDPNAPQDTIPLKAGVPIIWTLNSFWPIPFKPGAVNKLYVTNNGPSTATLKIRVLAN